MKVTNEHLDSCIINGTWAIDRDYAFQQLKKYIADIKAYERGVPLAQLGYSQNRQRSMPSIYQKKGNRFELLSAFGRERKNASSDKIPRESFAQLILSGTMRAEGDWCNYGMRDFEEILYRIEENPRIKGTLIIANSGGGEILAGQILKNAIQDCEKPVVVAADFLGSAAVLGTLPAREIVATGPSSRIGSIGVFASLNKEIIEFYKKNYEDIYAQQSSLKNNAFRKYLEDDRSIIQNEVDEEAKIFISEISKFRPKVTKNQDAISGKMFSALDAKKAGLVDSIGTINYAFNRLNFYSK